MKKFGVFKETEFYKKLDGLNRYHYEYITDSILLEVFDSKDDAINYCENIKLTYETTTSGLYADSFSVFELNDDDDIISDDIYCKTYHYDDLEKDLDIKIIMY